MENGGPGWFMQGVDVAADQGTPILASDRGTVTFAGWSGG
jgi:murein DD-endopeptidase MepM/ murein hydrolase activator NlpD